MTLILGRKDVEKLLTMDMAMEAVEQAFIEHGHARTQIPDRLLIPLEKFYGAMAAGAISEQSLYATLDEIVIGKKKGRKKDTEITIYKSTGMAIQDVATAKKVYEVAQKKGVGMEMAITP